MTSYTQGKVAALKKFGFNPRWLQQLRLSLTHAPAQAEILRQSAGALGGAALGGIGGMVAMPEDQGLGGLGGAFLGGALGRYGARAAGSALKDRALRQVYRHYGPGRTLGSEAARKQIHEAVIPSFTPPPGRPRVK